MMHWLYWRHRENILTMPTRSSECEDSSEIKATHEFLPTKRYIIKILVTVEDTGVVDNAPCGYSFSYNVKVCLQDIRSTNYSSIIP
jgi:hypothetical protein